MLKEILTMALRGIARDLAINPRNLRVSAILDDEEALLARVDAKSMGDLLRKPARKRVLRFRLGNVAYDVDLGATPGTRMKQRMRRFTKVRQRGDSQ